MLMLYQNALVLFGFLVIYYKTICCEVNLERGRKGEKSFWLKGRKRKRIDRRIEEKGGKELVEGERGNECTLERQGQKLTMRQKDTGQTDQPMHAGTGQGLGEEQDLV